MIGVTTAGTNDYTIILYTVHCTVLYCTVLYCTVLAVHCTLAVVAPSFFYEEVGVQYNSRRKYWSVVM